MLSQIEIKSIEEAKLLLKKYGYYVESLWHIEDVTRNYPECPEDVAQDILNSALTSSSIFDEMWEAIHEEASQREYKLNPII